MEALQSSSFIKRVPIICCCGWAGGIHCKIVGQSRCIVPQFERVLEECFSSDRLWLRCDMVSNCNEAPFACPLHA